MVVSRLFREQGAEVPGPSLVGPPAVVGGPAKHGGPEAARKKHNFFQETRWTKAYGKRKKKHVTLVL